MTTNRPVLKGVHHSARPTWKLRETVEFYRDKLGLPLVHAISARGWGPSNHPDFLHFFFDSGNHSTIAFFYYIDTEQPDYTVPVDDYRFEATHTAWRVDTYEELVAWRARLEEQGIPLIFQIRHELIESIYFNDPNGYYLEISIQEREMNALDAEDATRTLEAAMRIEDESKAGGSFTSIDQVWRSKAAGIDPQAGEEAALLVLDAPEFRPLIEAAEQTPEYRLEKLGNGYWKISSPDVLVFERKKLGFVAALWHAALTGGFFGDVSEFDRYRLQINRGNH
ncbi:VOC family protein [Pseudomonas sp. NY15364]|uniref:VOC family protein n=1 Tax=Pseudomonas sp. NY15364 TaxID=3400353 RepID=UPI003A880C2F